MARTKQTGRKGGEVPPQAAGHQGGPEKRALYGQGEEATPLQAQHGGSERDPLLPEVD
ncbi:hypothetical protein LEMLEM_LOCUS2662 [Lemmus lemmus]